MFNISIEDLFSLNHENRRYFNDNRLELIKALEFSLTSGNQPEKLKETFRDNFKLEIGLKSTPIL